MTQNLFWSIDKSIKKIISIFRPRVSAVPAMPCLKHLLFHKLHSKTVLHSIRWFRHIQYILNCNWFTVHSPLFNFSLLLFAAFLSQLCFSFVFYLLLFVSCCCHYCCNCVFVLLSQRITVGISFAASIQKVNVKCNIDVQSRLYCIIIWWNCDETADHISICINSFLFISVHSTLKTLSQLWYY